MDVDRDHFHHAVSPLTSRVGWRSRMLLTDGPGAVSACASGVGDVAICASP